jgi:hypothetical protein
MGRKFFFCGHDERDQLVNIPGIIITKESFADHE